MIQTFAFPADRFGGSKLFQSKLACPPSSNCRAAAKAAPCWVKPSEERRDERPATLRHTRREEINTGLVAIVSEGTDYTVDLALSLAGEQIRLRCGFCTSLEPGHFKTPKTLFSLAASISALCRPTYLNAIRPFPGVDKYLKYITPYSPFVLCPARRGSRLEIGARLCLTSSMSPP